MLGGGCGPGGRGRGRFMMGGALAHLPWFGGAGRAWLAGIDLTDEQVEKIAELKQKSFSTMAHGRIDKMEIMQAIFKELGSEKIDRAKVAELTNKLKEQKAGMIDLMIGNMTDFAEILTPEQRKKIRIKKIRQFLGSDDHDHEHEHEHSHEHSHEHRHRQHEHD